MPKSGDDSDSERNFSTDLRKAVQDRYVNVVITFVLTAGLLYLTTVSVFRLNIVHPLTPGSLNVSADASHTVVSLLILLLASLALGWILTVVKLPALLGALIVGVCFRNIELLSSNFAVDDRWEVVIRSLALACIIARWGMGIDAQALAKKPMLPLLLGVVTPLVETAAIALSAHLIFGIQLPLAIVCGFILAAVSPAITVPVMIKMQNQRRGVEEGVPSALLAASSIDNLICIAGFSASVSMVFSEDAVSVTILWTIFEIIVGIVAGILAGFVMWWFPLTDAKYSSPSRTVILAAATAAAVLGGMATGWRCAGLVAAILLSFIGTSQWKTDNDEGTESQERSFACLWNLFFMPLLFALIGMKFDFASLNHSTVLISLSLVGLGALARFISSVLLSSCSLNIKESIFAALSMLPKATVQAALGPILMTFIASHHATEDTIRLIVSACIVSIIVTATVGQLLLQLLGPVLLSQEKEMDIPTYVYESAYEPRYANGHTTARTTVITKDMFINPDDGKLSLRM